jgi:hypothetical protein
MAIEIPYASASEAIDVVVDHADDGAAAGHLHIKTAAGAALLADLTLSDPAVASTTNGTATLDTITADASADGTGTAATFYIFDSDSNEVLNGSVTATGGGGDIELSSTSITTGDNVAISSLTFTLPGGA